MPRIAQRHTALSLEGMSRSCVRSVFELSPNLPDQHHQAGRHMLLKARRCSFALNVTNGPARIRARIHWFGARFASLAILAPDLDLTVTPAHRRPPHSSKAPGVARTQRCQPQRRAPAERRDSTREGEQVPAPPRGAPTVTSARSDPPQPGARRCRAPRAVHRPRGMPPPACASNFPA
jgi:hypothetical protein